MTRHDQRVRLLHMLDHAREAVAMAQGESSESLRRKRQMESGEARRREIERLRGHWRSPSEAARR